MYRCNVFYELHIEHFNTEKYKTVPAGWLPKTLMIAAVLAYDNCDFKLPFATPYVPEWLAYGDFEKCDWTQY